MEKPSPSTSLLSDRAADRDLLEFTPYTRTLVDIIRDPHTEGPLVIGLFGTWGSGKTSLMQFVRDELRAASPGGPAFRTAWFDAWKYEKEEALWRALLLRVVDNLRDRNDENKDTTPLERRADVERLEQRLYRDLEWEEKGGLTIDWSKLLKGAAKGAIQLTLGCLPGFSTLRTLATKCTEAAQEELGKGEQAGALIEAFRRDVVAHHQAQLRSLEQFQKEFGELVDRHILRQGQRLVVFVDDLDRCLPEKAIEVLEAIKLFLDVRGCIFLLGLDQEVITRGIKVKYRDFAIDDGAGGQRRIPIEGAAYLEKIIQLPFRLPRIDPGAMRGFISQQANFAEPRCATVFAAGLETNPRKVKRAINVFLFIAKLVERKANLKIQPLRLAKIVVIYHSHTELYETLRQNPALLPLLEQYVARQAEREGSRTGRPGPEADQVAKEPDSPPVLPRLITPSLRAVLTLFPEAPEACFAAAEYDELESYFTLTRSTIVEAPAGPATAPTTSALAFPAPTWVRVPAGPFLMGTSAEDIERLVKSTDWAKEWRKSGSFAPEQPQHTVELDEYRIGRFPVTNAEYQVFVRETGRPAPQHWSGGAFPEDLAAHPVVHVSWDDASAYAKWLTAKLQAARQLNEREIVRLPTEAEWEEAARGDKDTRFYPWGDDWDPAKCNCAEQGPRTTTPVGKYSPAGDSPYGLADMAGNVWEWCADWYDEDHYRQSLETKVVVAPKGPEKGDSRVLRGGSWYSTRSDARCARRDWYSPDDRYGFIGFRVVASPFVSGR